MKLNPSLKNICPDNLTLEEFSDIVAFVAQFPIKENRKELHVSLKALADNIAVWLFETNTNYVMRDPKTDEVVGVFLNAVQSQWWSDEPSLVNTIAFILPEYRSAELFEKLLRNAEEYAKIEGMKYYFSPVACNKLDVKKRLLRRLGYTEVGAIMEAPARN